MITGQITGDSLVDLKFRGLVERIREEGATAMENVVVMLYGHVINEKLSGQVLSRRTGRLQAGVYGSVQSADTIIGEVGVRGVPYGRIHELGGKTGAHDIFPNAAKALSFIAHGERVFSMHVRHPGSVMPERSYLRSSLTDLGAQIREELMEAVLRAAK